MQEQLLHRIWQRKHFDHGNLITTSGLPLKIIHYGHYNTHAGPDFQNGQIQIENQNWFGHIEIHVKSSEWKSHKHHLDPAYNNVILHVVFEDNQKVYTQSGRLIPTLVLCNRIDRDVLSRYANLNSSIDIIPCKSNLLYIDSDKYKLFFHRLIIERLERKSNELIKTLTSSKYDWEGVLFKWLLKYACPKSNKGAFELLGERLSLNLIYKYSRNLSQLEALFLGQAGILNPEDEYTEKLVREYKHLKNKHKLIPMTGVEWRFSRMRPNQFPTLRLVQIAFLYSKVPGLFQTILNTPMNEWKGIFKINTSDYWKTHYLPGRPSVYKEKRWGKLMIHNILINVIIPLVYIYGKKTGTTSLSENAIELMYTFPAENNNVLRLWKDVGINAENAAQSQALIQLKSEYCDHYLCMNCSIGQELLFK